MGSVGFPLGRYSYADMVELDIEPSSHSASYRPLVIDRSWRCPDKCILFDMVAPLVPCPSFLARMMRNWFHIAWPDFRLLDLLICLETVVGWSSTFNLYVGAQNTTFSAHTPRLLFSQQDSVETFPSTVTTGLSKQNWPVSRDSTSKGRTQRQLCHSLESMRNLGQSYVTFGDDFVRPN